MFDVDVLDTRNELDRRPPWQRIQNRKVAALDLGSKSFHLIVAELRGSAGFTVVERVKERIQIGESVFQGGRIAPDVFERGLHALARLRDVVQRHAPEAVLAVATSAIREAANGRQFVRTASRLTGFPICIIDGLEEARLTCLGTRQGIALEDRRMALFDLGGGSTEVVVADDRGCALTASLPLGVLRLRSAWPDANPPSPADLRRLEQHVASVLEPTLAHVSSVGFQLVVCNSGAARALQRLAEAESVAAGHAEPLGQLLPSLSLAALERIERRLSGLDEQARRALAGHGPTRTDTLLTGAVALRVILRRLNASEALICRQGLRDGLIADYLHKRSTSAPARVVGF